MPVSIDYMDEEPSNPSNLSMGDAKHSDPRITEQLGPPVAEQLGVAVTEQVILELKLVSENFPHQLGVSIRKEEE
jgi:hypothetical protein